MKNFSDCGFKLYIPEISKISDYKYNVSFRFVYTNYSHLTTFFRLKWICKNTVVVCEYQEKIQTKKLSERLVAIVEFEKDPLMVGARLQLEFIQNKRAISVLYDVSDTYNVKLLDVDIKNTTDDLIEELENSFDSHEDNKSQNSTHKSNSNHKKNNSENKKDDSDFKNGNSQSIDDMIFDAEDSASDDKYSDIFDYDVDDDWTSSNPRVDRYIKATRIEMYYLKKEGGKRHKVTNGKLLRISNDKYAYAFDLEAELFISDDAPISLTINGIDRIQGFVILCEDFQIIIVLNENIGDNISSAYIMAEPWKLLEAMIRRTAYTFRRKDKLTGKFVNEGPSKSTDDKYTNIVNGQQAAKKHVEKSPVTVIWGPPGTGKTHTMAEIAINMLDNDGTVLVVSHSNVSVDGVISKIVSMLRKEKKTEYLKNGDILRYGFIRDEVLSNDDEVSSFKYVCKKNPKRSEELDKLLKEFEKEKSIHGLKSSKIIELNKKIKRIRNSIKEDEKEAVRNAKLIATTVSKLIVDGVFSDKKYDLVMFDEVSMAFVLQVISAASFAKKRFVCVGDFMQLSPIAQSSAKDILCEDIFSFLGIERRGSIYNHPWLVLLDEQRRMYPDISAFPNKYVYNRLLKDHKSVIQNNTHTIMSKPFDGNSVNIIDLTGCYCASAKNDDNSRYNILSGLISFASAVNSMDNKKVSIITPYTAQTRLIRALILDYKEYYKNKTKTVPIDELKCATVHQFQGSESDVIFFDAVESYPGIKPGWLLGKNLGEVKRLINVAVTRAKGKLITVANSQFWKDNYKGKSSSHLLYRLIDYTYTYGNVVSHMNSRSLEDHIKNINVKSIVDFYLNNDYLEEFLKDIKKAKRRIIISLPSGKIDENDGEKIINILEKKKKDGVKILIKSNEYKTLPEKWKLYCWGTENAVFPIVEIDENIIWYGVPSAKLSFSVKNTRYVSVCNIACRIKGKHTVEMINSLSSLEYRESRSGKTLLVERDRILVDKESDGNEFVGLAKYVNDNLKCESCGKPLILSKGKSRKFILWCESCKKTELLSKDEVNMYIRMNKLGCPKCNSDIRCGLSKYGLYIRCTNGHFSGLDEI